MKKVERKFFIGIDPGGKKKKTTGVCILMKKNENLIPAKDYCAKCQDIFGKNILRVLNPYLKNTKVIAIDAPLTKGRGKGLLRLYEKFLSTSIFRQARINPIPPALMPELSDFAREIIKKLEKKRFVLDINLIETFPTFVKKICKKDIFLIKCPCPPKFWETKLGRVCKTENQKSALICGKVAFLHSEFKTRYLGYKDGFLFLPEISFWKKSWREKFYQAWRNRPRLKYHRLITNIFKWKLNA